MLVELSKIHASAQPIRETWTEEKMQELMRSIADMGLLIPIKLRPNGEGYEIVYGHRRVEALRRLGRTDISSEVERLDDMAALKEAIVENAVREDMEELEKGKAFKRLKDTYKMKLRAIGELVGLSEDRVGQLIRLAEDGLLSYVNSEGLRSLHNIQDLALKAQHTRSLADYEVRFEVLSLVGSQQSQNVRLVAKSIHELPKEDRLAVLQKAREERLEPQHIKRLAGMVKEAIAADNAYMKESAYIIEGDQRAYELLVKQRTQILNLSEDKQSSESNKELVHIADFDDLVKEGISYIRALHNWMLESAYQGLDEGKFSPEARRTLRGRFDALVEEYQQRFRDGLDKERE